MADSIRAGIVDGVSSGNRTVRVTFPDRDDEVIEEIPLLKSVSIPLIGESVICAFSVNGEGFCLGTYG